MCHQAPSKSRAAAVFRQIISPAFGPKEKGRSHAKKAVGSTRRRVAPPPRKVEISCVKLSICGPARQYTVLNYILCTYCVELEQV